MDILTGAIIIVSTLGLAVLVLIVLLTKMFNGTAIIHEQVGLGMKVSFMKCRKQINLAGGSKLKFRGNKYICQLPAGDFFFPMQNNKFIIHMWKDRNGQMHPMKLRFDEQKNTFLVPDMEDIRFWQSVALKETEEIYRNKTGWEKIAPYVAIAGTLAFVAFAMILTMYYYGQWMDHISGQVGGSMQNLADALHTVASTSRAGGVVPPTP